MRVLVVGGTGFIGPPVVTRLARLGHEVAVYHRGAHEADLPFGVHHFHSSSAGAPVVEFPEALTGIAWDVVLATFPIGARDADALMKAFRGIARRVVGLSSGDVYRAYGVFTGIEDASPDPTPLTEDAPLRTRLYPYRNAPGTPEHLSDYEKILVERAVLSDPAGLPGTVLRLPALYGPGDAQHRFARPWEAIARGRREIALERPFAAWRWTHGYVEDVAQAIVLAVTRERAKNRVYNVGEAPTPTIAERWQAFGRAIGWSGSVVSLPEGARAEPVPPGDFRQDIAYDTSRIRAELDWKETVPAAEAFRKTARWESAASGAPSATAPVPEGDESSAGRKGASRGSEGSAGRSDG
jgi:nucleoside-diphosphate-sugar epimerase